MKKALAICALFTLAAIISFAVTINSGVASSEAAPAETSIESPTCPATGAQEAQPMSACVTKKCGLCPGPKCDINGICCYIKNNQGKTVQEGIASCGCDKNGKVVCKCDRGEPG